MMKSLFVAFLCGLYFTEGIETNLKDVIISLHNKCRAADGQSVVSWDKKLEKFASDWAGNIANSCGLFHSSNEQRKAISGWTGKYAGENLAWGMSSAWSPKSSSDRIEMVKQGVNMWCDEKADYNLASNTCNAGKQCGHYTQMVWHNSNTIGCALKFCPNRPQTNYILSCVYQAGGNIIGQRPFSVVRPTKATKKPIRKPKTTRKPKATKKPKPTRKPRKPRFRCKPKNQIRKNKAGTIVTTVVCKGNCRITTKIVTKRGRTRKHMKKKCKRSS